MSNEATTSYVPPRNYRVWCEMYNDRTNILFCPRHSSIHIFHVFVHAHHTRGEQDSQQIHDSVRITAIKWYRARSHRHIQNPMKATEKRTRCSSSSINTVDNTSSEFIDFVGESRHGYCCCSLCCCTYKFGPSLLVTHSLPFSLHVFSFLLLLLVLLFSFLAVIVVVAVVVVVAATACAWCLCFGFCAKVAKTPSALSVAEVCRTLRICMRVSLSLTILVPPSHRIAAIVHTSRLGEKGWPYKTWSLHIRVHMRVARVLVQNIVAKLSRVRRYAGHPMNLNIEMQLYKFIEWRQTTNSTFEWCANVQLLRAYVLPSQFLCVHCNKEFLINTRKIRN